MSVTSIGNANGLLQNRTGDRCANLGGCFASRRYAVPELNGVQLEELRAALLAALPTPSDWYDVVLFGLNASLDEITAPGSLRARSREVLVWTVSKGRVDELIDAALRIAPNSSLRETARRLDLGSASRFEAIVRQRVELVDVEPWRTLMTRREAVVCRVEVQGDNYRDLGTGFLVASDLLMTNYHVLQDVIEARVDARRVILRFDYKQSGGVAGKGTTHSLHHDWLVAASTPNNLDYVVVKLAEHAGDALIRLESGLHQRGFLTTSNSVSVNIGDPLMIIQHPAGLHLKLAMGTVRRFIPTDNPRYVKYDANTLEGSSGSPCFSTSWSLVALHHRGGESENQGVLLSSIVADLNSKDISLALPPVAERSAVDGPSASRRKPWQPSIINPSSRANPEETFQDREEEFAKLTGALDTNRIHLLLVTGREGIGKSALVGRALKSFEQGSPTGHRSGSFDYLIYLSEDAGSMTCSKVIEHLSRVLGLCPTQTSKGNIRGILEQLYRALKSTGTRILVLLDGFDTSISSNRITDPRFQHLFEFFAKHRTGLKFIITARTPFDLEAGALTTLFVLPLEKGLSESDGATVLRNLDTDNTRRLKGAAQRDLKRIAHLVSGNPRALERVAALLYANPTLALSELATNDELIKHGVATALSQDVIRGVPEDQLRLLGAMSIFFTRVEFDALQHLVRDQLSREDSAHALYKLVRNYFIYYRDGKYFLRLSDRRALQDMLSRRSFLIAMVPAVLHNDAADYYRSKLAALSAPDFDLALLQARHLIEAGQHSAAVGVLETIAVSEHEGHAYLDAVLAARKSIDPRRLSAPERYRHFSATGRLFELSGDVRGAAESYGDALQSWPEAEARSRADVQCSISEMSRLQGEYAKAWDAAQAALNLLSPEVDDERRMLALTLAGDAARRLGDFSKAVEYASAATELADTGRFDPRTAAKVYWHAGQAYRRTGELPRAAALFDIGLELARAQHDDLAVATALNNLAQTHVSGAQYDAAFRCLDDALAIHRNKVRHPLRRALCVLVRGTAFAGTGQHARALRDLAAAKRAFVNGGDRQSAGYASVYLAHCVRRLKRFSAAQEYAQDACLHFNAPGTPRQAMAERLAQLTQLAESKGTATGSALFRFAAAVVREGINFAFADQLLYEALEHGITEREFPEAIDLKARVDNILATYAGRATSS